MYREDSRPCVVLLVTGAHKWDCRSCINLVVTQPSTQSCIPAALTLVLAYAPYGARHMSLCCSALLPMSQMYAMSQILPPNVGETSNADVLSFYRQCILRMYKMFYNVVDVIKLPQ